MSEPMQTRCTAKTQAGNPCRKWAIQGGTVCMTHGGAAGQVRAKANRRLAIVKVSEALKRMNRAPAERVDLMEEMLRVIAEEAQEERIASAHIEELKAKTDEIYGENSKGDGEMHVLIKYRAEVRHRLTQHIKLALDAGVDERRVQIAEEQGAMISAVFRAVFDEMGLDPQQKRLAEKSAARHLKALPSAG